MKAMNKFIWMTIVMLGFGVSLHAQRLSYGVHAGVTMSGYVGGTAYTVYDKSGKVGYEIGGDIWWHSQNGIFLASGVSLLQTGGSFAVMSNYVSNTGQGVTEFPQVNTKKLSVEVPIKLGYQIALGTGITIMPHIGLYTQYAVASIKDNVKTNGSNAAEKWNCLKEYNKDLHHIDAMKRWDLGALIGIEAQFSKHYTISANYKRGFWEQSSQYELKQHIVTLSFGYVL